LTTPDIPPDLREKLMQLAISLSNDDIYEQNQSELWKDVPAEAEYAFGRSAAFSDAAWRLLALIDPMGKEFLRRHEEAKLPAPRRNPAIQALAEAWASIDGKLDLYRAENDGAAESGFRDGYDTEARELIERLEMRGYTIVPLPVGERS
jgi:hypothetical protein